MPDSNADSPELLPREDAPATPANPNDATLRLCLLDGMALIYRAYFAFMNNPRVTSTGQNTSAIFGFLNTVMDLRERLKPTHLAVAFDTPEPTARHKEFPAYKAQREAMPEDLSASIPEVDLLLAALRIPVLRSPGWEADDLIGTLAKQAEREGYTTWMITPDKDFAQLVHERILLYRPLRDGVELLDPAGVCEKYGIARVEQVIDLLGLMGDASDNIPGVPGIGPKTAQKLIAEFDSVENLLENTGSLKGKQKENLETFRDQALLSKRLATIETSVPLKPGEDDLASFACGEPDIALLQELFERWEFRSVGKRLFGDAFTQSAADGAGEGDGASASTDDSDDDQMDLFAVAGDTIDDPNAPPPGLHNLADTPHDYKLVADLPAIKALITDLCGRPEVVFDLETASLEMRETGNIVGIAFAVEPHAGWYVPVPPEPEAAAAVIEACRPFFLAADVAKIGHNLKFDLSVLKWNGVTVHGTIIDTMLAHSVLAPEMRHGMDYLAESYLSYAPQPITALIGTGKEQKSMRDVPVADVAEYAVEDADVTLQLWQRFRPQLDEDGAARVFYEVESPLVPVLVDMEFEGIRLDVPALHDYSTQLGEEIRRLEISITEHAGIEFNIDSPKQLGEILFDRLKLDPKAKKTRKTGQYKTSEDILLGLAARHDIVQEVLNYRQARKLLSTYVDSLPNDVNATTGRVHTTYSQAVTATGRMASSNPNLQNIPIRSDMGREIRKAFVARDDEHVLMAADYSQIELRIIAHISGDAGLREAFLGGLDIHAATAARIYGVPLEEVHSDMRRKAKMVNFGIAYGISAFGLSQRLGISRSEAGEIIDSYFAQFPGVRTYIDTTINSAREDGYVSTMLGRRRYLRDINSRNATARGAAERNAINSPIQGSAADMIKLAMIAVHRRLVEGGYRTRMLLQVHDELVFDLYKPESEAILPLVREAMATALPLDVPVIVDIGLGTNWLEAH